VSEEFGDDASFLAGVREFYLPCGCSVGVVFLVLSLFIFYVEGGCYIYWFVGYVWRFSLSAFLLL
jgi:hypothetical protein